MTEIGAMTPELQTKGPGGGVREKALNFIKSKTPEGRRQAWEAKLEDKYADTLAKATPEEQQKIHEKIDREARRHGVTGTVKDAVAVVAVLGAGALAVARHGDIGRFLAAENGPLSKLGEKAAEFGTKAETVGREAMNKAGEVVNAVKDTVTPAINSARSQLEQLAGRGSKRPGVNAGDI